MSEREIHISAQKKISNPLNTKSTPPLGLYDQINNWIINHSPISTKELAIFYRLLATMINAGIDIVKALRILNTQVNNLRLQNIIKELLIQVESGQKLSTAMGFHPHIFNDAARGIVYAGEASGKLNSVLLQLAHESEKNSSLKNKVRNAMIYPVVILIVLLGVAITVMIMVIPKITTLFETQEVELPFITQVLINTSDFLTSSTALIPNWILIVIVLVIIISVISYWKTTYHGKYLWDKIMLRLPVFGMLNRKIALTSFARELSSLTASGLSIIKTLNIVSDTVGNEVYRRRIKLISMDVKKGISIADNIQGEKFLFPPLVVSLISVGEKTAQMQQVSAKIADFYEEEVDSLVSNLSKLMEPMIVLVIGIGAALLIAAVMLPVMQIAEVASQM